MHPDILADGARTAYVRSVLFIRPERRAECAQNTFTGLNFADTYNHCQAKWLHEACCQINKSSQDSPLYL